MSLLDVSLWIHGNKEIHYSFPYVTTVNEHTFTLRMADHDISSVPVPTDRGDGVSCTESGKIECTIDENAVFSTTDSSRNQAHILNTSDNAPSSAPSSSNPAESAEVHEAAEHETTEPDGYVPQTLDVSGDMA